MVNHINKSVLLLLLLPLLFISVNCQLTNSISEPDYSCVDKIVSTVNDPTKYVFNSSNLYEYCNPASMNFLCIDGLVYMASVLNQDQVFINPPLLNCLQKIVSLYINGGKLPIDFFSSNTLMLPQLSSLLISSITTDVNISGNLFNQLNNFYIELTTKTKNIILSEIRNVNTLELQSFLLNGEVFNWTYTNDLTSNGNLLNKWTLPVGSIPSMKFMNINQLNLQISLFDSSSFSNLANTYSDIISLTIQLYNVPAQSLFDIPFLPELFNCDSKTIVYSLPFRPITNFIDLSTITLGKVINLSFLQVGYNFNVNNKFPFINSPSVSSIESFTFNDGNFTNIIDFNIFGSKLTKLDLSNNLISSELPEFNFSQNSNLVNIILNVNKITGTVPNSWCQLANFQVRNNLLSGDLPSCFQCFYSLPRISSQFLPGNKFNPIQSSPCTTTIPNLKFNNIDNCYYYTGNDLGFDNSFFTTDQNSFLVKDINWVTIIPNKKFKNCYVGDLSNRPKLFKFIYQSNGNIFTLSSEINVPVVNSVLTNSTVINEIIFQGSYFTYDKSNVSVTIDSINCIVTSSTFNIIKCNLDSFKSIGNKQVIAIVTVGGLSTQITFNPQINVNNIKQCASNCIGNSYCSSDLGICVCSLDYGGPQCNFFRQIVTSIESVGKEGGIVSIYGEFGSTHNNVSITIGDTHECTVNSISDTYINCTVGPIDSVNLNQNFNFTQNGIIFQSKELYQIKQSSNECQNNCNGNGKCINGQCNCNNGWIGFDCFSPKSNSSQFTNTTIDNNGNTIISYDLTKFKVLITKLVEINFDESIYKEYQLLDNWKPSLNQIPSTKSSNYYSFEQSLITNIGIIQFTLEQVLIDKIYEFSGSTYKLDQGSIKISVNISNYQFSNQLNTLQLQIKSELGNNSTEKDCNSKEQTIDQFSQQSLNYISISKDNKQFSARFINKVISNGKPTLINTKVIQPSSPTDKDNNNNSITIGLSIPHCSDCYLDPDFSLLLQVNHKDSCDVNNSDSSKLSKTKIIAIIVSIVGASILVAAFLMWKKFKVERLLPTKLKKMNQ